MPGADRAINMALRVTGIGEAERDFKRVGDAGEKSFAQVSKSANGASREVSEYTARLKRAVANARELIANTPALNKGSAAQIRTNRNDFIKGVVSAEQERIMAGVPDATRQFGAAEAASGSFGMSLTRLTAIGAAAGTAIAALGAFLKSSVDAFVEHEQALDSFEATLSLAGNRSAATGGQIKEMAARIVDATQQTEEAALGGAATLARVSGLNVKSFEEALAASARFADAVGKDLPAVIDGTTAPVLQALADRDMKALVKATEDLNDGLRANILKLAEAGKTADAQRVFIEGLADAAGDGPNGLTSATDRLGDSWDRLKTSIGEDVAGPAAAGMDGLANTLDGVREGADKAGLSWIDMARIISQPLSSTILIDIIPRMLRSAFGKTNSNTDPARVAGPTGSDYVDKLAAEGTARDNAASAKTVKDFEQRYGPQKKPRKGGGGGKSDAEREAERLKREADSARTAADRIAEANADVVSSYALRTSEIEAKVGLEGEALAAVERHQAIEAAARKINIDAITKEVEARRALALSQKKPFDEAAATRDATTAVNAQQAAMRDLAERTIDAQEALDRFTKSEAQAKALLEGIKSPLEQVNTEIETAIGLLRDGFINADQFNARMDQLAENLADVRYEADKGAQAWQGFGRELSGSLVDIAMSGGSALDILQQLIQVPLDRLLEANVVNPLGDWIDGLTGNNRDKNVADARASLPDAARIAGASVQVDALGVAAQRAAAALNGIPLAAGEPVAALGTSTDQTAAAMNALIPLTGQFGGALGQTIAILTSGVGGGGGGLLGTILGIGGAMFGGGGPSAGLVSSVSGAMAANPGLFASGTDRVPVGKPFYVGENGREMMEYTEGGGLRVHGEARTRRFASEGSGGVTIIQHNNIPERADPRRTAAGIARSTQGALGRSLRKGLAMGGGRFRD